MGVSILIDTNMLYVKNFKDYNKIQFLSNLKSLINDIKENEFKDNVTLVLPEIVIEELIQHQVESYNNEIEKLLNKKFPCFNVTKHSDYEVYIKSIIDNELELLKSKSIKIKKAPIPKDLKINKLVKRAIKKNPPFSGKEKESDKGFKDVILWESLIEYKNNSLKEKIILCTEDKIFSNDILNVEYFDKFKEDIVAAKWYSGKGDLINILSDIFESTPKLSNQSEIFTEFRKVINTENLTKLYNTHRYSSIFRDRFVEFDKIKEFDINELSELKVYGNDDEKDRFHFMAEIRMSVGFYIRGNTNSSVRLLTDVILNDIGEFEVLYNTMTKSFSIIGFGLKDSSYHRIPEFYLD